MKTNPNELINPFVTKTYIGNGFYEEEAHSLGLTKREYFAAVAMQGLCACSIAGPHKIPKTLAIEALIYADALIEELNKEK